MDIGRTVTDMGHDAQGRIQSPRMITDTDKEADRKNASSVAKMPRLWKKGDIEPKTASSLPGNNANPKDPCRYRSGGIKEDLR